MNNVPFSFVHRIGKRVAHKFAVTLVHDVSWELDPPMWLKECAQEDRRAMALFCNWSWTVKL